jgi:hypothetical protein
VEIINDLENELVRAEKLAEARRSSLRDELASMQACTIIHYGHKKIIIFTELVAKSMKRQHWICPSPSLSITAHAKMSYTAAAIAEAGMID